MIDEYPEEVMYLLNLIIEEADQPFSKVGANLFCQHLLNEWDKARPGTPSGEYRDGVWVNYE